MDFRGIALPRGTYRVQVHYAVNTDILTWCEVTDDTIGRKNLRTNGELFFSGLGHSDFEMWLMRGGGDLFYHLMRVEGIRDAFLTGQFLVRISPEWQQGYGYASPIFYGETVLYPAGLHWIVCCIHCLFIVFIEYI